MIVQFYVGGNHDDKISQRPDLARLGPNIHPHCWALNWDDGKIQFFLSNGQYISYDVANRRVDEGYPEDITGNWPGLERYKDNLTGMINWGNGKVFMFLDNGEYLSYDVQADSVDPGYPKQIDNETWPGIYSALRAASK